MQPIIGFVLVFCGAFSIEIPLEKTRFRMPGVRPLQDDAYLCRTIALDEAEEHYLVGFEPHANMRTAHHILLYGCAEPGVSAELNKVWNCGEMSLPDEDDYLMAPICHKGPQIIYAWARDAPELELPNGVGFKVGGTSPIHYLVLQVHYIHKLDKPDFSGLTIESTADKMPKSAATLLMVTGGQMAANSKEHFETACVIDENVVLHPFAFRTHTHKHGTVVSGWKVTKNDQGIDRWDLIGKQDPMKPQLFYPVKNDSLSLQKDDIIAARCSMRNDEDRKVVIGATGQDEMCNFYMMYWVNGDKLLQDNICSSPGPPQYYWRSEAGLNHIPDKEADTL